MNTMFFFKNKIYYILLSLICLFNYSKSQTQEVLNHKKYWFYKTRFNNDFVKVGTGQGESLPFSQRGFDQTTFLNHSNKLKAGDVSAQLGVYIGVLATEYRLLKNKGQDITKVKHDLFCALSAFNRIDFNAESIISSHPLHPNGPTSQPGNLNGFFIRDDIPADFVNNNYTHFNYFNFSGYNGGGSPPCWSGHLPRLYLAQLQQKTLQTLTTTI